jgi:hypothetical protein
MPLYGITFAITMAFVLRFFGVLDFEILGANRSHRAPNRCVHISPGPIPQGFRTSMQSQARCVCPHELIAPNFAESTTGFRIGVRSNGLYNVCQYKIFKKTRMKTE